jgi:redox-sensitive bicupin YhaK (pirin superfamily)
VGKAFGVDSKIKTETPIHVLMAKLEPKASLDFETIPGGCFVYTKEGAVTINGEVKKEREEKKRNRSAERFFHFLDYCE